MIYPVRHRRRPCVRAAIAWMALCALLSSSHAGCTPPSDPPSRPEQEQLWTTVCALAFSPDGNILASAESGVSAAIAPEANCVRLYQPTTRAELGTLETYPLELAFSPDGTTLASNGLRGEPFRLWRQSSEGSWDRLDVPDDLIDARSFAFSPDGAILALGVWTRVAFWEIGSRKTLGMLDGPRGGVSAVAFSPDGRRLAAAGDTSDGDIVLFDVEARRQLHVLCGHRDDVLAISFSPDGKKLASASRDMTDRLWDVAEGEQLRELRGQKDWIYGVAWTADGNTVISAAADQTIRFWDPHTGKETRRLEHPSGVTALAISADGRMLASGGYESILIWDLKSREVITTIERPPAAVVDTDGNRVR